MAKPNKYLISSIRKAAEKIQSGTAYAWGHMGSCNCGHLAQEITKLSKQEIHSYAMRKHGDWSEQVLDYCPTSGQPFDLVISQLLEAGLDVIDLQHLEKLSDPEVLECFDGKEKHLFHNKKDDVVKYMFAWANVLEIELLKRSLNSTPTIVKQ